MTFRNDEIKQRALDTLKGNWGLAVGGFFILGLITAALQIVPVLGSVAALILGGPLALGGAIFALNYSRKNDPTISNIFDGFKNFGTAMVTYLIMAIIIIGFTLLLIIPGIIRALAYSQVFFILANEPDIQPMDALKKSRSMMDGYKTKFFLLSLGFIGWALLSVLTLGIGLLFLVPYVRISMAKFHDQINPEATNSTDTIPTEVDNNN